jgi:hypothetical protein
LEERMAMGRILESVKALREKQRSLQEEERALVNPFLSKVMEDRKDDLGEYASGVSTIQFEPPQILAFKNIEEYNAFKMNNKGL